MYLGIERSLVWLEFSVEVGKFFFKELNSK